MRRSEPSKNLVHQREIEIYQHCLFKYDCEEETVEQQESTSILTDIDQTGVEDALVLLNETMEIFESLHEQFYNDSYSLTTPPVVLLSQLLSYQVPSLIDELNELKKTKLNECIIIDNGVYIIGYVDKEEYIGYLLMNYKGDIIKKLIEYIKSSSGNAMISSSYFNENEILILIRQGLITEQRKESVIEHKLLYPNQFVFAENLNKWRKKIITTVASSPFHIIQKKKLEERYDMMCFSLEYLLTDLLANSSVRLVIKDTVEYIELLK
ncbi:hypothetical protein CL6EHI_098530 [Entamoeba histolytica]|uniref:Uncharacterized protein n=1 Tax=Entamoeba histolytica TaxID=5759 RepID=A0A175JI91_ENTHI|nr:hypothetical protein CL6EHI_098530 [Entamoeba histolytica]